MATPGTVAFYTLGCKLNYSESSAIARQFEQAGYGIKAFEEGADLYIINTCSVTDFADRKCRKVVRQALRTQPDAKVVVIGCYAQLKPKEIAEIPGVDLVLGASEKFRILDYVDQLAVSPGKGMVIAGEVSQANVFTDAFSFGDRTRSFLKVQDGCDYKCTFCTIPQARGKSRSDTVENVVANALAIADQGVKEIVLTGVNIGDFGNGTEVIEGQRPRKEALFIDLIQALEEVTPIKRFRISSIEPNLCTEEIIQFVAASKKFVPHFHMPLQSGSNRILALMKRRYLRELYAERIHQIKTLMPHACIGVDVIVGFPGESEADFQDTFEFLHSLDVSYLHVFTYSERANTPAIDMAGVVDMAERRRRNELLTMLSEKKRNYFNEQFLGTEREVLFEVHKSERLLSGYTDNYIRVELPFREGLVNTIGRVALESLGAEGCVKATWAYETV